MTIVARSYSCRLKTQAGQAGRKEQRGTSWPLSLARGREAGRVITRDRGEREDCQHASGFGKRSASSSISVSFKAAFIPTTVSEDQFSSLLRIQDNTT